MAIKAEIVKNGIQLTDAYVRPAYLAVNFKGDATVNFETFPTDEKLGQFPNESLAGFELTEDELNQIKTITYNAMKRTELLKEGEDC